MSDLKPCPFCEGKAELRGGSGVASWIICENEKCRATQGLELSGENAVKRWNTRPAEEALKAEVESLKKKLENVKKHLIIHRDHSIQSYRQDGKAYQVLNEFMARFCNGLLELINTDTGKGGEKEK